MSNPDQTEWLKEFLRNEIARRRYELRELQVVLAYAEGMPTKIISHKFNVHQITIPRIVARLGGRTLAKKRRGRPREVAPPDIPAPSLAAFAIDAEAVAG